MNNLTLLFVLFLGASAPARAADPWVIYEGGEGPGAGKHIVLISGDEEYRSEEALPQLGKILSVRHGFKCTVLFAIDPETGTIDPNNGRNIPGTEALASANLMIIATRFRDLPDEQMKHVVDYIEAGKPVIGLRTATHAFNMPKDRTYAKYGNGYDGEDYAGGFGKQVLGEKWVSHHGHHKVESCKALIAPGAKGNPILRGIGDGEIWCPSDVYGVELPLSGDGKAVLLGQVLAGMEPTDPPAEPAPEKKTGVVVDKNDPMMPVAWTRTYKGGRVFTTTMGASIDLANEALRRLVVNAAYWCVGLEDEIPEKSNVEVVGIYEPTFFGFMKEEGYWRNKGMKPSDFALEK